MIMSLRGRTLYGAIGPKGATGLSCATESESVEPRAQLLSEVDFLRPRGDKQLYTSESGDPYYGD